MRPLNILALFDGMSCGQLALKRAGIPVKNYFASEIDRFAIEIAMKNFPDTIQLGDVRGVNAKDLPKIDLVLAGSPCQGFRVAGKGLNFDDPRSALFFEFTRILEEAEPSSYLLENVKMKKEWEDVISDILKTDPVRLNSNLVSAQNRSRLYWTNAPIIYPLREVDVKLTDVLIEGSDNVTIMSDRFAKRQQGRRCLVNKPKDKAACLSAMEYVKNGRQGDYLRCNSKGEIDWGNGEFYRKLTPVECERLQTVPDNYTAGVSNTQRYKMLGNGWTIDIISHFLENSKPLLEKNAS